MPVSRKLLTLGGFVAFFTFGFVDNLKGALLPEVLSDGGYSYSQGGTILLAGYLGFIAATLAAGALSDRVGNVTVLLLASVALITGCGALALPSGYLALIALMSLIGIGLGSIEIGGNGLMIQLHSESRTRYLNLLATCHGLGSLIVPLYAAGMLNAGLGWRTIYASTASLGAALLWFFWPRATDESSNMRQTGVQADDRRSADSQPDASESVGVAGRLASKPPPQLRRTLACFYILIASYVATELGVAAWLVQFLQEQHAFTVTRSSIYLSGFFVLLMLGRLLGAFATKYLETKVAITAALALSGLSVLTGLLLEGRWLLLLPLSGFFMSIVFPTVTAMVSRLDPQRTGSILGVLFACAGLGGALGPWAIGIVSDFWSLKVGLAAAMIFSVVAIAALFGLPAGTAGRRSA